MWRVRLLLQSAFIDLFAAAVFIIPLFLILGKFLFKSAKLTALYTLFAFYLTAMFSVVGFPGITSLDFDSGVNVVPIVGMIEEPAEAFLNVLLFLPLGAFLPILWEKFRNPLTALLSGFGVSLFIEAAQLFTFRTSDINDLITNTVGAAIGYFASSLITKGFKRLTVKDSRSMDFFAVFGSVAAIMFIFEPLLHDLIFSIFDR